MFHEVDIDVSICAMHAEDDIVNLQLTCLHDTLRLIDTLTPRGLNY